MTCVLAHELGHTESVTMFAPPEGSPGMNAIQKLRSTRTYLERTTLESLCGAATKATMMTGALPAAAARKSWSPPSRLRS